MRVRITQIDLIKLAEPRNKIEKIDQKFLVGINWIQFSSIK